MIKPDTADISCWPASYFPTLDGSFRASSAADLLAMICAVMATGRYQDCAHAEWLPPSGCAPSLSFQDPLAALLLWLNHCLPAFSFFQTMRSSCCVLELGCSVTLSTEWVAEEMCKDSSWVWMKVRRVLARTLPLAIRLSLVGSGLLSRNLVTPKQTPFAPLIHI